MWHIRRVCVWSPSMILKAVRPVFFVAVFWVAESFFFLIEPSSSVHHPERSVTIIESEQEKRLWECFMSWRVCVCLQGHFRPRPLLYHFPFLLQRCTGEWPSTDLRLKCHRGEKALWILDIIYDMTELNTVLSEMSSLWIYNIILTQISGFFWGGVFCRASCWCMTSLTAGPLMGSTAGFERSMRSETEARVFPK